MDVFCCVLLPPRNPLLQLFNVLLGLGVEPSEAETPFLCQCSCFEPYLLS